MIADALSQLPPEPTPLQKAEDRYHEAEHRLGMELMRYQNGDTSPEQARRYADALREWRAARDDLAVERAAQDDDGALPF